MLLCVVNVISMNNGYESLWEWTYYNASCMEELLNTHEATPLASEIFSRPTNHRKQVTILLIIVGIDRRVECVTLISLH